MEKRKRVFPVRETTGKANILWGVVELVQPVLTRGAAGQASGVDCLGGAEHKELSAKELRVYVSCRRPQRLK